MSTDFFGTKVSSGKTTPYVPRPNDDNGTETLVLLNATIPANCKLPKGTRISLIVKTETCDHVALATLIISQQDNAKMDIALDSYAEFSVMGPKGAEIHVTGHYLPRPSVEEDTEDGGLGKALEGLMGAPSGYEGEDDEDDSDYEEVDEDEDVNEAPAALTKIKQAAVEITEVKEEPDSKSGDLDNDDDSSDDAEEDEDEGKPEAVHAKEHVLKPKEGTAESDEDDDEDDAEDNDDESDEDDDDEEEESDDEMESAEEEADEAAAAKENGRPTQQTVDNESKRSPGEPVGQPSQKRMKHTKFANGFEVQQLRETTNPNAPQALLTRTIVVKYRGTLPNGKVFDETPGNKTFTFRLGVGDVIKGWDKGLVGMRVGDKRKLVVPPSMAYGGTGVPKVIPKNSTLHFEVELMRVKDAKR